MYLITDKGEQVKKAFKMKLNPQMKNEYKVRHKNVYSELEEQFKLAGVLDYTIWFDEETNLLFGYVVLTNEQVWNNIENTEVCTKWWEYMSGIMETNNDNSPVSKDLDLVYDFIG